METVVDLFMAVLLGSLSIGIMAAVAAFIWFLITGGGPCT